MDTHTGPTGDGPRATDQVPGDATAPEPDAIVVDAIGKACPLPVIDLAAAVGAHEVGSVFRLLADDPAARVDVPVWCRMQRQRLDDVRDVDGHVAFTVTKVRAGVRSGE